MESVHKDPHILTSRLYCSHEKRSHWSAPSTHPPNCYASPSSRHTMLLTRMLVMKGGDCRGRWEEAFHTVGGSNGRSNHPPSVLSQTALILDRELVRNIIGFLREVMDGGIAISRRRPKKIGEKHASLSIRPSWISQEVAGGWSRGSSVKRGSQTARDMVQFIIWNGRCRYFKELLRLFERNINYRLSNENVERLFVCTNQQKQHTTGKQGLIGTSTACSHVSEVQVLTSRQWNYSKHVTGISETRWNHVKTISTNMNQYYSNKSDIDNWPETIQ